MRIGLLSDAHGNVYAAKAVIEAMKEAKCDYIISLGDAIAIGPFPKETMDLLLEENITMIKGNHELYYLMDEKVLRKQVAFDGEFYHQMWVKEQLKKDYIQIVEEMPMSLSMNIEGHQIYFAHYAFKNSWYENFVDNPTANQLSALFQRNDAIIAFGHHHPQFDLIDEIRHIHYINPGACGITLEDEAPFCIMEIKKDLVDVRYLKAHYNRQLIIQAMKEKNIPGGDFILEVFFKEK
ncbi:MAG: metallophosphoesterase family protein [Clostridia bacterium]|nr:metallophosphoesterase family protein [Clostridia bacterium]